MISAAEPVPVEVRHHLVIEEDGDETAWYVEHPDCPTFVLYEGDDAHNDILGYECGFGWLVDHIGAEAFDTIPTEVGRYPIDYQTDGEGEDFTAQIVVAPVGVYDCGRSDRP